jgi:hypothetical protein
MARRARKPPRNPVSRYLAIAAFTTLAVVGVAALFDLDTVLGWTAVPLLLICSLLVIAYTAVAIHHGWIATVGHRGQIDHYERSTEPVSFWVLTVFYLGATGPAASYMVLLLTR